MSQRPFSLAQAGAAWLAHGLCALVGPLAIGGAPVPAELPEIQAVAVIESVGIAAVGGAGGAVRLGGVSDLHLERPSPAADAPGATSPVKLWAITDRGPNGVVKTEAGKVRTLLEPAFVPRILAIDADDVARADRRGHVPGVSASVQAVRMLPIVTASGRPSSGRANGVGRDEAMRDHRSGETLAFDPDGIDPEAVVVMPDGTFWIAEEYRPSLIEVGADGRMRARLVPAGSRIVAADVEILEVLPEVYSQRKDNRGFESLALVDGGTRVAVLLQSPLPCRGGKPAARAGNVRMLVVDVATRRVAAEHVYRAGDPADPGYLVRGCAPKDVKICGMAAIGGRTVLVIEQGDDGSARLYAADLTSATDTLARTNAADLPPLEAVTDLQAASISPVAKTLVADLAPLLPRMRTDARVRSDDALKLEGLAVLDDRHVLLVNDDDFAVQREAESDHGSPRTCLWVVRLPSALPDLLTPPAAR